MNANSKYTLCVSFDAQRIAPSTRANNDPTQMPAGSPSMAAMTNVQKIDIGKMQ